MIYVRRSRVRPPAILGSSPSAQNELRKAIVYFESEARDKQGKKDSTNKASKASDGTTAKSKGLTFKVYKDDSVKIALERLFYGKCAYCESYYAATQPMDVEHWRPKADVDLEEWEPDQQFKGYYWLAADWLNLLPSCIDCNRARKQKTLPDGSTVSSDKGNQFPVMSGSSRISRGADRSAEQPLLLNPTEDDPQLHLSCAPEDPSILQQRSVRGKASIDVYGLNRASIVVARRELLFHINFHLRTLQKLFQMMEVPGSPCSALAESLVQSELELLARLRHPSRPFSMMAREVIEPYLESLLSKRG